MAGLTAALLLSAGFSFAGEEPFAGAVLEPEISADAVVRKAGTVTSLEVGAGAAVKRNQVLAKVEVSADGSTGAMEDDAYQTELEWQTKAAKLAAAQKDFDRKSELRKQNVISSAEYDEAEGALKVAQAEEALAGRNMKKAIRAKASGPPPGQGDILAPIAGMVYERNISIGELLAPTGKTPPFRVAKDLSRLKLVLRFGPDSAARIKTGQKAWVKTDVLKGRVFNASVSELAAGPVIKDGKPVYEVVLSVENPDRKLWPSMDVDGAIVTGEGELEPPSLTAEEKTFTADDVAVVIGIEKYPDLPVSDFSGSDAQMVSKYLLALGIRQANLQLLTDSKASFGGIRKTIESWLPNRVKKGSRVFVYYSGHGAPEPATGDAYWVPSDGDPNYLPDTAYPLKRLYEILGALPAREVMVVMDSCFSGAGSRGLLAKGARPLVPKVEPVKVPMSMAVLTATRAGQISTSSPDRKHGLLTYHFLRALSEGKKSLSDVFAEAMPAVEDEAKALNTEQTPELIPGLEQAKGRFFLRK
jgi:RND family efflux transporter MFP subunit